MAAQPLAVPPVLHPDLVVVDESGRALVRRTDPSETPPFDAPVRRRTRSGIRKWANAWDKDPKPFIWTKTTDEILETLAAYCERINDSER